MNINLQEKLKSTFKTRPDCVGAEYHAVKTNWVDYTKTGYLYGLGVAVSELQRCAIVYGGEPSTKWVEDSKIGDLIDLIDELTNAEGFEK